MGIKAQALQIVRRLHHAGHVAYFAGGWVRDHLMNLPHDDIDIATSATPEQVQALFERAIMVGASFGVVMIPVDGHSFEVASFRKEGLYVDGRRPEFVDFASPEEDAERRDFTINGMFYDPENEQVIDYVGGRKDIKSQIIRAIGDPSERFREDRLRMIRAVRFSACLGFPIESGTREAIAVYAKSLFPAVSVERIWQEFKKIGGYPAMGWALKNLLELGLLEVIFPSLEGMDVHTLQSRTAAYEHFPPQCPSILYLMELFQDQTLKEHLAICRFLRIPNEAIAWVEFTESVRQMVMREEEQVHIPEVAEWVSVYADSRFSVALSVVAARLNIEGLIPEHEERIHLLAPHIKRRRERTPLITSDMLKNKGIVPGKRMGELLQMAERYAVNSDLSCAKTVLEYLQSSALWSAP